MAEETQIQFGDELAHRVSDWLRRSNERDNNWRRLAKEDYEFYLNKQWTDTQVNKLSDAGRPYLTLNRISPVVRVLTGMERQSRLQINYLPVQDDDRLMAGIYNHLVSRIMDVENGYHESSLQFQDGIICGRGYLYVGIDFTRNMLVGKINVFRLSPFNVYVDPDSRNYDLSDAKYVMRVIWAKPEEVRALYPETGVLNVTLPLAANVHADEIWSKTNPLAESGRRDAHDLVPIIECWYRESEHFHAMLDKVSGHVAYFPEEALLQAKIMVTESKGRFDLLKNGAIRPRVKFATLVGNMVVEEGASPLGDLDQFPIIPYFSEFTPSAEQVELRHMGVVRALKDPQREFNKRRSQMLHIINTMAHSGWLTTENAWVDKPKVDNYGSSPGVTLEYRRNAEVKQIVPTPISKTFIDMDRQHADDIRQISLVNADLQGLNERQSPGVAVRLRQQQGLVGSQDLFDNLKVSRKMLGKALVHALHVALPEEQIVKMVAGKKEFEEYGLDEILSVLKNRGPFDLDVSVSESPHSPTQRLQNFMTLVELREAGVPIPPLAFLEATDLPHREKLLEQIEEMMEAQQGPENQDGPQQARNRLTKQLRKEAGTQ